jgi:hypothetical protein
MFGKINTNKHFISLEKFQRCILLIWKIKILPQFRLVSAHDSTHEPD